MEDLNGCGMSGATLSDSIRSPINHAENSSASLTSLSDSSEIVPKEYSRLRRKRKRTIHGYDDYVKLSEKESGPPRIKLISDKPVQSQAMATLPKAYLYIDRIAIDEHSNPVYGVFAKKRLPKQTQFGPIEGVLVESKDPEANNFLLLIEQEDGLAKYLDTSDENMSNWMRFVRAADSHEEQNLVLVQDGLSLYFNTTKSINAKTELRVWYSIAYADKWGIPLLEPSEEENHDYSG